MVWVRSEYAGELAVLSAWVTALLPWTVSVGSIRLGSHEAPVVVIRFVFVRIRYIFGVSFGSGGRPILPVWQAPAFEGTVELQRAAEFWLLGAAVFAVALALSVALYLEWEHVETLPVDPVRAMGVLLVGAALPIAAATSVLWRVALGLTVPVGVVFMFLLGGLLLIVERA